VPSESALGKADETEHKPGPDKDVYQAVAQDRTCKAAVAVTCKVAPGQAQNEGEADAP